MSSLTPCCVPVLQSGLTVDLITAASSEAVKALIASYFCSFCEVWFVLEKQKKAEAGSERFLSVFTACVILSYLPALKRFVIHSSAEAFITPIRPEVFTWRMGTR